MHFSLTLLNPANTCNIFLLKTTVQQHHNFILEDVIGSKTHSSTEGVTIFNCFYALTRLAFDDLHFYRLARVSILQTFKEW
jgi:hypothetical protein